MQDREQVRASFYRLHPGEIAEKLGTHLEQGLSSERAQALLQEVGPNELPEEASIPLWKRFLNQFKSFLVIILLIAAVISITVAVLSKEGGREEYIDAAAIFAIVILNAVLGVVQESRAENALKALREIAAPNARVVRDGHVLMVPARELVPGDLVLLEAGNYVPADMRLTETANLRIEEAALTGESVPAEKHAAQVFNGEVPVGDRINSAFMGTVVSYGRGQGLVVSTGPHTQLGLIAEMLRSYEAEPTPLQEKLDQLGRLLGVAALILSGIVFVVGLLRALPATAVLGETILNLFLIAVSLAIAAVPEGLPAVVTICLALGTQRMLRRHALIRNLPAVETLGSATVICSDKTGTLTQNEMTVVKLWADDIHYGIEGRGYQPWGHITAHGEEVSASEYPVLYGTLLGGLLCNDSRLEKVEGDEERFRMVGDPTEGALVVAAAKAGLWQKELEVKMPRVAEIPFESERKRMTTVHIWSTAGETGPLPFLPASPYMAFTKGAPDLVLERCAYILDDGVPRLMNDEDRQKIAAEMDGMAGDALRVLAVSCRPFDELPASLEAQQVERDLIFLGITGMIDPPRPEVRQAIRQARFAGIKTVMITGDHKRTAMAIASDLHMFTPGLKGLTGEELDKLDDEAFRSLAPVVDVYARVSPQHKVRIVDALKAQGQIVAMTGDGVNDAPAVKRADIGVAMGITGTDVAKEAADMVLTDDNYTSIVSAIEEGRVIFANIRKFVYYLLSCNVGEILVVFIATLLGWPPPLQPIHLLMLNLVTDGFPALALGMEPAEPGVMDRPPRDPKEPIIHAEMWYGIAIQSILIAGVTLIAFALGLYWWRSQVAQGIYDAPETLAFATLVTAELIRAFTVRSERLSIWRLGFLSNMNMIYAVGSSLVILLAIIYVPFLDPIFHTIQLGLREWALIIPLSLAPAVGAETTKLILRRRDAVRMQRFVSSRPEEEEEGEAEETTAGQADGGKQG